MALDVMRDPSAISTELRWYQTGQTTPFALLGHIGPVLATVPFSKYGAAVREVWFGDEGWAELDGRPIDESDILAFAIAEPFYAASMRKVREMLGPEFNEKVRFEEWLNATHDFTGPRTPRSMLEAGQGEALCEALQTRMWRGSL